MCVAEGNPPASSHSSGYFWETREFLSSVDPAVAASLRRNLVLRPTVGTFLGGLDRRHGEPEMRSPHRVLTGYNFAVVVTDGLAGPAHPFGYCVWEIDVDER